MPRPEAATWGTTYHPILRSLPEAHDAAERAAQTSGIIELHAELSAASGEAAMLLEPYQRAEIVTLAGMRPNAHGLRLAHPATAPRLAIARADALRVIGVVHEFLGPDALAATGLPGRQAAARHLPAHQPVPRASAGGSLAVGHGDPTPGNVLADQTGKHELSDYDLAFVGSQVEVAAHTWATLCLRPNDQPSPAHERQFRAQMPYADAALDSGLADAMRQIEVTRSAYADLTRGALGAVPFEIVQRSMQRMLGPDAPPPRRLRTVLGRLGERHRGRRAPEFPSGLMMRQPHALPGLGNEGRESLRGLTPLEQRLLAAELVQDVNSPDAPPLPRDVQAIHEAFTSRIDSLAARAGLVPLHEYAAHLRDSRIGLTMNADGTRVLPFHHEAQAAEHGASPDTGGQQHSPPLQAPDKRSQGPSLQREL
ncbi:hypothetical protein OG216_00385 [Streptomycetaceae bacterium NBC_01309]